VDFSITAASGESVTVSSDNWMMAMGKAMAFFAEDAASMVRWVCTPGPDGMVTVEDPVAKKSWTVKPSKKTIKVVAKGPQRETVQVEDKPRARREETPLADDLPPPPMFQMPKKSRLEPPPPSAEQLRAVARAERTAQFAGPALAEKLWDLGTDLPMMDPNEACKRTLEFVLEIVPCEAASIARGSKYDFHMVIAAAFGPVGDKILNRVVPFGEGLVCLAFDAKIPVQVTDAQADERHNRTFDAELGFVTKEVLCLPVVDAEDQAYGVIQLINPKDSILPEEIDIVTKVARVLATALSQSTNRSEDL